MASERIGKVVPTARSGPPRIALVCPGYASGGGGVPRVAEFLLEVIETVGSFEVDLVSLATSRRDEWSVRILSPRSWHSGVRVAELQKRGRTVLHVGAFAVELELQRYRPRRVLTELLQPYDVVQVVSGTPAWVMTCAEVNKPVFLQVATFTTWERTSLLRSGSPVRRWYRRAITRAVGQWDLRALSIPRRIFVENVAMMEALAEQINRERICFAPPGVDTHRFAPKHYRSDGYLLSVGRFADPRKNVRLLFRAYAQLRSSMPNVPDLVLAGRSAPRDEDLRVCKELGICSAVRIHTGVSDDELADLFKQASMFIMSSDEEGLGIAILEAMASGLPVVATDCGGPRTLVLEGVTGHLTPVGDASALAQAVAVLLKNPRTRQAMGERARRIVEQRFSLRAAGRPFLQAYQEAVSSQPRT